LFSYTSALLATKASVMQGSPFQTMLIGSKLSCNIRRHQFQLIFSIAASIWGRRRSGWYPAVVLPSMFLVQGDN
jgi:hypothetical protein